MSLEELNNNFRRKCTFFNFYGIRAFSTKKIIFLKKITKEFNTIEYKVINHEVQNNGTQTIL